MFAAWVVYRVTVYLKYGNFSKKKEFELLLLFVYVILIMRGVLFPMHSLDGGPVRAVVDPASVFTANVNYVPFTFWGDFYPGWQINVFGNIFLFVPVGILFPLAFENIDSVKKAICVGIAFTCTIEFLQLFLSDRCTDVDDIMLNSLGAAMGAVIWFKDKKLRRVL